jgi:hypothetical protein
VAPVPDLQGPPAPDVPPGVPPGATAG